MALEVVAVRRDGFDGDIELEMDGLPSGVTAHGLKIPAGKSRGIMLVTAAQDAPRAVASARIIGRAEINGVKVVHPCRLASMAWPVPDSAGEIPYPRLLADVPVSVSGYEFAPITLTASERKVWEVTAGSKLTIPLVATRRSEFSGATMSLRTFGAGFESNPSFTVPLTSDALQATLDLAALKTPPGEYTIAFYAGAVAKYRYNLDAVVAAETAHRRAEQELMAIENEAKKLAAEVKTIAAEHKAEADQALEAIAAKQKAAAARVAAAADRRAKATEAAKPREIVDIVISEPIAIRVQAAESR
jgi:hypothetical protein